MVDSVVFVINQEKVINNYKISPVYRNEVAGRYLAEERVTKDITNLRKYIQYIDIRGATNLRVLRRKLVNCNKDDLLNLNDIETMDRILKKVNAKIRNDK